MNVLITGTWRNALAQEQAQDAQLLGTLLAQRGYELLTGGGEGIPAVVAKAYTQAGGKKHTAILVDKSVREHVGEKKMPADEHEETTFDYPQRNAYLVSKADAIIALNGRLGTLTELIHAANDYDIPAILLATNELADWVDALEPLKKRVLIARTPQEAVDAIKQ